MNSLGRGFGPVVITAVWHAGDPGSMLGRDGLCTFGCIAQRFKYDLGKRLRYVKPLIYILI
jgi:hypothetical protein